MIELQENAISARKKLEELRTKRNRLFDGFLKNPSGTELAHEIKELDNQIAELVGRNTAKRPINNPKS